MEMWVLLYKFSNRWQERLNYLALHFLLGISCSCLYVGLVCVCARGRVCVKRMFVCELHDIYRMYRTLTIAKFRGVYVYVCACAGVSVFCPYMFMRTYAYIQIPHAYVFSILPPACVTNLLLPQQITSLDPHSPSPDIKIGLL